MKKLFFVLTSSAFLASCAFTRVTSSKHEAEVNNLKLIGMTYSEAVATAEAAGFKCYKHLEFQPYKSAKAGGQLVKLRTCWKKSVELVCPQQRDVAFEYSVEDEKVLNLRTRITEQACF